MAAGVPPEGGWISEACGDDGACVPPEGGWIGEACGDDGACVIAERRFGPEARYLGETLLRFGSLSDCANAALTGHAPKALPDWLA